MRRTSGDAWRLRPPKAITPDIVDSEPEAAELRALLHRELGPDGTSLGAITDDLQADEAARLRTRIRSLLADVIGAA